MSIAFILGSAARTGAPAPDSDGPPALNSIDERFPGPAVIASNRANAYGLPSSPIYSAPVAGGHRCLWLFRHGLGRRPILPHRINYCANIYALAQLQTRLIVAFNAVGSLVEDAPPGTHLVPDQLSDYTWGRCPTMHDLDEVPDDIPGDCHTDFTHPFSEGYRKIWLSLLARAGLKARAGGVCAVTQGPRLESKAEIDRLAGDGAHYVNMTLCPEAALARELGIDYLCSGYVSNWAAGVSGGEAINIDECRRLAHQGLGEFLAVANAFAVEVLEDVAGG